MKKYFGPRTSKPVETFTFQPESPITTKIIKEVIGPDPASVNIGWRFNGMGSKDDDMCSLITSLLYNGTAGLMDLNLNQAQKVLGSNGFYWPIKDYSLFSLSGQPKEGQSLEEVEKLLIEQINLIKKRRISRLVITGHCY